MRKEKTERTAMQEAEIQMIKWISGLAERQKDT